MSGAWDRIESVFLDALERPGEERAAFLAQACAGDAALRAEVEAMLAAHQDDAAMRVESRLLAEDAATPPPDPDRSGERVGAYRLLSRVGSGGMGDVYLGARADDAYERQVAIKLVRPGYPGLLDARFRRERDILARLDHPLIARLYDGGATENGAPFLVMEYVDGLPITEYCDREMLGVRERLVLFRQVCEAVQAAHERLIVHRDLKPSNILVAPDGTPRLLDFGIARILDPEIEQGEQTRSLDRVMTPEHAAPEQIRGESPTTATDVYALGVLLYELLTGARPLHFPTRSPAEIERIAAEVDPRAPSRCVQESDQCSTLAAARRSDPARLSRRLRGDLDAIVLMALRKEPQRRYGTAGALADDVTRFLNGMPVRAQPDTAHYRAMKFVRRNRVGVTVAALVGVLLVGFAGVTAWQARRVAAERDRAEVERDRAERVVQTLVQLFESTRPEAMPGGDTLRVSQFLERGAEMVASLDPPDSRAELFGVLASIHSERGELVQAASLLDSALAYESDPRARARLQHRQAVVAFNRDGPTAAEPLLRASLELHRELYGPRSPDVAAAIKDYADAVADIDEQQRLYEESLAMRRATLPPGDPAIASSLNALGRVALDREDYESARAYFEESASILAQTASETSASRLAVDHNLSAVYARLGDYAHAETVQRRVLRTRLRIYGGGLPVAGGWESLGVTLANLGRLEEAGDAFAQALAAFEEALAPGHWRIANALRNVAALLALQERYQEGLPYIDRAIEISTGNQSDPAQAAYMRGQRALMLLRMGDRARALTDLEQAAAAVDAAGERAGKRADVRGWLGMGRLETGDARGAEAEFRAALSLGEQAYPAGHPRLAALRCGLAMSLVDMGMRDEANALLTVSRETYLAWGLADPWLRHQIESLD